MCRRGEPLALGVLSLCVLWRDALTAQSPLPEGGSEERGSSEVWSVLTSHV